jgi:hypothetical protein
MGKKYIIELLDDCPSEFKGIIVFGLTPEGQIAAEPIPVEDLTPYTEPDLEQVREEAYEDGYKTAKVQCNIQAEKDLREVGERHYQKGLSDAWEAARKICTNWVLPDSVLSEIFGMDKTIDDIMKENTASEVIAKIRAYEQEKEIQVGDEVNAPFGKAIVVNINSVAEKIWLVYADGHGGFEYFKDAPTKTGRHFPEIAEVFAKMKETDNG